MTEDLIQFVDEDEVLDGMNGRSGEPWFVLMVDDDPDVHLATRMTLNGFEVHDRPVNLKSAYCGQDALTIICQEGVRLPDLVLMDIVMSTPTDGIDTVHAIRKTLAQKNIPFVIIRTGQAGLISEDALRLDPDVDMVLVKSKLDAGQLKEAIRIGLTEGLQRSTTL